MSIFNDKVLKSVAEAASKVMQQEELKGNQHKIDANKNGKIDAHDFKLLRAKKKPMNEELEQLDEVGDTPAGRKALGSYVSKAIADKSKDRTKGLRKATSRMYKDDFYGKKNEEVEASEQEQLNEAFPTVADAQKRMAAGKTATGSVTKTASGLVHKRDYKDDNDEDDTPKKKTPYGARQKRNLGTKLYKESFADMISSIQTKGTKSLSNIFEKEQINEEPDNEQFTKELKDQEASMSGKKKQPSVAAPATQGVKNMAESEDVQQEGIMDVAKGAAGVVKKVISNERAYQAQKQKKAGEVMSNLRKEEVEQIDERELTKGEAEKKEEYVKGMKKKLSGFKQRYGERAKEVMYATATKMAKED